jgi:uncharacterized HAD superfamily protein
MKLGFDLDDVVVDTAGTIRRYLKKVYDLDYSGFINYDFIENKFHLDEDINKKIILDLINKASNNVFISKVKPSKEAVDCLRKLKKSGHSIHYITARKIGDEYETALFLRRYHIPFDSIHNVGHGNEKGALGRVLNLDFFLDDLESNLESMFKYKKRWRKGLALFTQPWNANTIDASRFTRLDNWIQVSRHLGIHRR